MQNFSALSRAELIGALLAPVVPADHPRANHVNDLESPYFGTAAAEAETSDALLARKLGVARELLMRDLHAQMQSGPVIESPQALRDWLRAYFTPSRTPISRDRGQRFTVMPDTVSR